MNLFLLESRKLTAVDQETTVTSVTFLSSNQQLNHTSKTKYEDTSTVKENHKTNAVENFMIIILALLTMLTSTYLGKCVHRRWISRTVRVRISSTTPTIALGEINETGYSYDRVQTIYDEPQRYQTTASDAIGQNSDVINHENNPENLETVSCSPESEPKREKSLNLINTNKKDQHENQPDTEDLNNVYITPCM